MPITSGSLLLIGRFVFADPAHAQAALDAWVQAQPAQNAYDTRDDRELIQRIARVSGATVEFFEEGRTNFAQCEHREKLVTFVAAKALEGDAKLLHTETPSLVTLHASKGQVTREVTQGKAAKLKTPASHAQAAEHFRTESARQDAAHEARTPNERFHELVVRDGPSIRVLFLVNGDAATIGKVHQALSKSKPFRLEPDLLAMPVEKQTALLEAVRERTETLLVGCPHPVAAIHDAIAHGKLREDLFYRLSAVQLDLARVHPE